MALPYQFIIVRHAESEGNVAEAASRNGDHSHYTVEFRNRHNSQYRLTERGVGQAKAAGEWLRRNNLDQVDQAFVSEYIRALETAAHLGLCLRWRTNDALHERDSGLMALLPQNEREGRFADHLRHGIVSPYFGRPPEGESLAAVRVRLHAGFLPVLAEGSAERRVLAVSHGRTIRMLRGIIEHIPFWEFEAMERAHHPEDSITNGHIFHYTRVNPEDASDISTDFDWVRSICPWDEARTNSTWRRIKRASFTGEELLAVVERFPRHVS